MLITIPKNYDAKGSRKKLHIFCTCPIRCFIRKWLCISVWKLDEILTVILLITNKKYLSQYEFSP